MIDIQSILKGTNPNVLGRNLNNVDPFAVLSQLGVPQENQQNILSGDFSYFKEKRPDILNYGLLINKLKSIVNPNLIQYFFKKVKEQKPFTKDEEEAYFEAWNNWFNQVFKLASHNIFRISDEYENSCLIINKDDSFFLMIIHNEIKQLIHLGNDISKIKIV